LIVNIAYRCNFQEDYSNHRVPAMNFRTRSRPGLHSIKELQKSVVYRTVMAFLVGGPS
jgi:hypothetical protein